MVFSPVPVYLDPHNWPQEQNPQEVVGGAGENSHLPPPHMPPQAPVGAGGGASIRPGSMTERARLAKIPQPETALKCPRCESTNTKFCYYNNYNLTQPRHFCKTCRRYWTRGGALRNVPVGGGCRRNKRSKGNSRSKSPMTSSDHQSSNSTSTANAIATSNNSCSTDVISHLPFFPPMHNLADFANPDIGMSFGGIQSTVGNINSSVDMGTGPLNLSARFADQWKLHQFSLLGGFERAGTGIYQFEGDQATDQALGYGGAMNSGHVTSGTLEGGVSVVKLEENQQGSVNLSRNFLSIPAGNDQYWNSTTSNAWTDLSGSTSSAGHYIM